MKIIAVAGTGSGCGKTTVACRILRAIPGLGAIKISPREEPGRVEWGSGAPGKDTHLYANSGAVRVARIVGRRDAVGANWDLIRGQFEGCAGVVIEGACALAIPEELFVVFVVGNTWEPSRDDRNSAIEAISDVVVDRSSHFDDNFLVSSILAFLSDSSKEREQNT